MKKVILLGGGGHAKCVIDTMLAGCSLAPECVLDVPARAGQDVLGVKIAGSDADLPAWRKRGLRLAFVALGSTGDPARRVALWLLADAAGFDFPKVIHPSAVIARHAEIGRGVYVGPGAIINSGAVIEDACIINSGAIVEHDCRVGEFAHIAPGAVLSGGVTVGDRAHVGTGCAVSHGVTIGADTVVGAGSVVVKDLPARAVCVGVPARKIKGR